MNDFMLMTPTNQTFAELLNNGVKYVVPRFQRDYSWDLEQLEDLWNDIILLQSEGSHYMGYIVLQQQDINDFGVIDGQQRMVTLSLWVLAAMSKIKALIDQGTDAENNQVRYDELGRLIGAKDIVTLRVSNKLTLNRNNNAHYKNISSNLSISAVRGLTSTNRLLQKAFSFFQAKHFGNSGEEIASFVLKAAARLLFTKIVVQDNFNAYRVFETLNARGVQLSTPDLLKNYIYSVVTEHGDITDEQLDDLDERWAMILSQLREANFTEFLRYHHNGKQSHVTKGGLFKAIRTTYKTSQSASQYLTELTEAAPVFAALSLPHDELWQVHDGGKYRDATHYLDGLQLFQIKQPWVILLAAYKNFTADEFLKVLRYLYVLSIRYNAIGRDSPNEQEQAYSKIARKINSGEFSRASHVKNSEEFKGLYPSDEKLKSDFALAKIPSRHSPKKIRFLLAEIETSLGASVDYARTTLEHVCPYEPNDNWHDSFGEGVHDIADRLGNLVLLDNDQLGRSDFSAKKMAYRTSGHPLAEQVAKAESWDLRELNNYQRWLGEQAIKTWRVD
jgi:hypothetical protein